MLTLSGISKIYPFDHQRITALSQVSLEIAEGEFTVIMGPSGSGKSTLLTIMGGLDRPTEGVILFRGKKLTEMGDAALSNFRNTHIGFVFQDSLLLPHLTLLENVMLPLLFSRPGERAEAGAAEANGEEEAKALLKEAGLGNRLGHTPPELSGGQKQRACIARALITNPPLVLADEPTGNLDSKTGREIIELFKGLHEKRKCTFVIATHDEAIAQSAKRVISLKDGKII